MAGSQFRALILGIGGQDGSYLAEHLLSKGYNVHGVYRRSSGDNLKNLKGILGEITLHKGDLDDPVSIAGIIDMVEPLEIYNEADQDNVDWSFSTPSYSMTITAGAVARTLETIRQIDKTIRFFQPCSAMMYGHSYSPYQDENTSFAPQSPYAVAKTAAYYFCQHYRREHGMHVSTAILYNHESVRRNEEYLLHMICANAVRRSLGISHDPIRLGNPECFVDIGLASEYVQAFPEIVGLDEPSDFVIGSGRQFSIQTLTMHALNLVGLEYEKCVVEDPSMLRPGPQPTLHGKITKAQTTFGFSPKTSAMDIVGILIGHYQQKYKAEKRSTR